MIQISLITYCIIKFFIPRWTICQIRYDPVASQFYMFILSRQVRIPKHVVQSTTFNIKRDICHSQAHTRIRCD